MRIKPTKEDLKCIGTLAKHRWPNGPVCPKCNSRNVSDLIVSRGLWQCRDCRGQFGVFNGTIFEGTRHSPYAIYYLTVTYWHIHEAEYKRSYDQKKYKPSDVRVSARSLMKIVNSEKDDKETKAIMKALKAEGYTRSEIKFIIYGDRTTLLNSFSSAQRFCDKLNKETFFPDGKSIYFEDYKLFIEHILRLKD